MASEGSRTYIETAGDEFLSVVPLEPLVLLRVIGELDTTRWCDMF